MEITMENISEKVVHFYTVHLSIPLPSVIIRHGESAWRHVSQWNVNTDMYQLWTLLGASCLFFCLFFCLIVVATVCVVCRTPRQLFIYKCSGDLLFNLVWHNCERAICPEVNLSGRWDVKTQELTHQLSVKTGPQLISISLRENNLMVSPPVTLIQPNNFDDVIFNLHIHS